MHTTPQHSNAQLHTPYLAESERQQQGQTLRVLNINYINGAAWLAGQIHTAPSTKLLLLWPAADMRAKATIGLTVTM